MQCQFPSKQPKGEPSSSELRFPAHTLVLLDRVSLRPVLSSSPPSPRPPALCHWQGPAGLAGAAVPPWGAGLPSHPTWPPAHLGGGVCSAIPAHAPHWGLSRASTPPS